MTKNSYRVHVKYVFDRETDKSTEELLAELQEELNKKTSDVVLLKSNIRLERLRQRERHRISLAEFNLNEVLPFVSRDERKKEYKIGDKIYEVRMDSKRYFVFRSNPRCSACGLEGTKFLLEQSPSDKNPHFNLYAEENGVLVLMTKDHIHPKSCDGSEVHSNFQTLCAVCNGLKGSSNLTLAKIGELRQIYNDNKNLPRKKLHTLLEQVRGQFSVPLPKPPVPRKDRKAFLDSLKSEESVVTNTDLRVWTGIDGHTIAKSVYDKPLEDKEEFASIRMGAVLKPHWREGDEVVVTIDGWDIYIHQGFLE